MAGLNKVRKSGYPPEAAPDLLGPDLVGSDLLGNESSADRVRAEIARISDSEEFARSERLRRFLKFIVDETLAGRGSQIKAYTVALAVCDRDEHFDPSIDPIVRIEAGRLRRALQHYYLTQGSSDTIRIDVPKGGYRPVISEAEHGLSSGDKLETTAIQERYFPWLTRMRAAWLGAGIAALAFGVGTVFLDRRPDLPKANLAVSDSLSRDTGRALQHPTIVLKPLQPLGTEPELEFFAQGITEDLMVYLSQNSLLVVRYMPATSATTLNSGPAEPSEFSIAGSVRKAGNTLRVLVHLTQSSDERTIWSHQFDRELIPDSATELQDEIARAIVAYIEQSEIGAQ